MQQLPCHQLDPFYKGFESLTNIVPVKAKHLQNMNVNPSLGQTFQNICFKHRERRLCPRLHFQVNSTRMNCNHLHLQAVDLSCYCKTLRFLVVLKKAPIIPVNCMNFCLPNRVIRRNICQRFCEGLYIVVAVEKIYSVFHSIQKLTELKAWNLNRRLYSEKGGFQVGFELNQLDNKTVQVPMVE